MRLARCSAVSQNSSLCVERATHSISKKIFYTEIPTQKCPGNLKIDPFTHFYGTGYEAKHTKLSWLFALFCHATLCYIRCSFPLRQNEQNLRRGERKSMKSQQGREEINGRSGIHYLMKIIYINSSYVLTVAYDLKQYVKHSFYEQK